MGREFGVETCGVGRAGAQVSTDLGRSQWLMDEGHMAKKKSWEAGENTALNEPST